MVHQPTIIAELLQWQFEAAYAHGVNISGTIHKSSNKYYVDGERFCFIDVVLSHFDKAPFPPYEEEHWLMKTKTNTYFKLRKSEKK